MKDLLVATAVRRKAAFYILIALFLVLSQIVAVDVFAGGMPQTEYRYPIGKAQGPGSGDFVSSSVLPGLNSHYSYYIEVPPGTGNLTIDIFDANVINTTNNSTDENLGSAWDTSVTYNLISPSGVTTTFGCPANSINCSITGAAIEGTWYTPTGASNMSISNPAAGHWEFRLTMDASGNLGNNVNTVAVRARDTSASNPKELNMYAMPFDIPGVNGALGATRDTHIYPYITSGCSFMSNGWDWDFSGTSTGGGTVLFTSRLGATPSFAQTGGAAVWQSDTVPITTSANASDYGIWTDIVRIKNHNAGVSNIVTYYIGDYTSPTPVTAGSTNTFRLYMPTSAGATIAPVKPVVGQSLTFVAGSGTNPPGNGTTSTYRVQIFVYNPTPYAITFSSPNNLVTAYIPGTVTYGAVTYANKYYVSQGTASLPSSGGSGAVSWNPGTVAAGTTAVMTYDIFVHANTTGTIVATGTTASNGTQARFVDETGNTTQSRATYTFGPLCELSVSSVPTLATVSSIDAYATSETVIVEWQTSSEINTLGYYLLRLNETSGQFERVNDKLLPAMISHNHGGIYRLPDSNASVGKPSTYIIQEIELRGKSRKSGPFTVTPADSKTAPAAAFASREPRSMPMPKGPAGLIVPRSTAPGQEIKIAISEDGIYSVDASTISNLLGLSVASVQKLIQTKMLGLSSQGNPVAYMTDSKNSRILFYGQGIDSVYTKKNIYWLKSEKGVPMGAETLSTSDTAADISFVGKQHFEENRLPATALASGPSDDYWFWAYIAKGLVESKTFDLQVVSPSAAGGTADLTINLQGVSEDVFGSDHHAVFTLNGTAIGEDTWTGGSKHKTTLSFDQGLIQEGSNALEIKGVFDPALFSIFYINSFDLSYNKLYKADGNMLVCQGGQNPVVTITGFTDPNIRLFDITDPLAPKMVGATVQNNSVSFKPVAADALFIAVTESAIKPVTDITAYTPVNLKSNVSGADYLIITGQTLKDASAALAKYRKIQLLTPMVVTVEDIMNTFSYGIYNPDAIRDFLGYAKKNWSRVPKYVVLAGNGSYDYKDYLGLGGNIVPPLMVSTPDGLFPSDNHYADINGDHIAEMAIGRLPASSAAELVDAVKKIIAYENGAAGAWSSKTLLVADVPDDGGDFVADSDSLAPLFPSRYSMTKVYLPNYADVTKANNTLMAGINGGAAFMNYFGHGGLDRLSQDGLLKTDDVESMTNGSNLPLITAMTCVIGNFAFPGMTSLGEALVLKANGGAAAVWSATGLSDDTVAAALDKAFYQTLFNGGSPVLGDAILRASKGLNLKAADRYMLDIYTLLGDPALRIKGIASTGGLR